MPDELPRITNRRAFHDYFVQEKVECGVVLTGSEVKSVRSGQVQLGQGFARVEDEGRTLMLHGVDIAAYSHAGPTTSHERARPRKLLAHKRQIKSLMGRATSKGTTLVPLAMYFSRGFVKVELGVCVGKQSHDKRQDLKTREAKRAIERGMTRKRLG